MEGGRKGSSRNSKDANEGTGADREGQAASLPGLVHGRHGRRCWNAGGLGYAHCWTTTGSVRLGAAQLSGEPERTDNGQPTAQQVSRHPVQAKVRITARASVAEKKSHLT